MNILMNTKRLHISLILASLLAASACSKLDDVELVDMDTTSDMPVADQGADLPATDLGTDLGVDQGPDQSSACASACGGTTPVCDAASGTCVGCLSGADCSGTLAACDTTKKSCVACVDSSTCTAPTSTCDTAANSCVQCVGNANCNEPTSSRCEANSCAACMSDNDCSHIAGKSICSSGTCVECTVGDESKCGGKSCDPATNTCTSTGVGSVGECGACVADSECNTTAGYRCIPLGFGPEDTRMPLGGFCLLQADMAGGSCPLPYRVIVTKESLSGAPSEAYCGVNENYTSCPAVLSMLGDTECAMDDECGVVGVSDGKCLDFVGLGMKCNIECANNAECINSQICRQVIGQPANKKYCAPR